MILDVAVAPAFLDEDAPQGCACAVVDALRATSTITVAMASGAAAVHPCLSIEEARTRAGAWGGQSVLLGGEERGLRRLTREKCDRLVRIPMAEGVESLNLSVAAGILLFEVVRQRGANSA